MKFVLENQPRDEIAIFLDNADGDINVCAKINGERVIICYFDNYGGGLYQCAIGEHHREVIASAGIKFEGNEVIFS